MEIKGSMTGKSIKSNPVFKLLRKIRKSTLLALLLVGAMLAGTSLVSIYYGMHLYKTKQALSFDVFFENLVQTRLNVIPNYIRGVMYAKPERIVIDIKHKHFQKLAYKRQVALNTGILLTEDDDFVPAQVRYRDQTINIKMRLKGDWTDHLLGEKWSFRIKVRGDNTLFGMKQFSIHRPETRNYIYEWLIHQALKRENVISLRYEFINVVINGKDLGVYALEEHFEKRLIEHNQYREGPIIKLSENLMWVDRATHHLKGEYSPTGLQEETSSPIDVFKQNSIMENPALFEQFVTAHNLLEAFRTGELPAHQALDIEKFARFFAIADVLGASHGIIWHNFRFYYNPVTSLLEPIGFDGNGGKPIEHIIGSNRAFEDTRPTIKELIFRDPEFYRTYIRELSRIANPAYVETFLSEVEEELNRNLDILYSEFPYFHFSKQVFYDNIRLVQNTLNPAKGLHAYYHQTAGDQVVLELGNIQAMPLEVISLAVKDSIYLKPTQPIVLQPKIPDTPPVYHRFSFVLPKNLEWADSLKNELKINYRVLGLTALRQAGVFPWPHRVDNFVTSNFMLRPPNAETFDFLIFQNETREIMIRPGEWTLDRTLILPAGYTVLCGENTRIDLVNSALILSRSPLDFRGTEEGPILIHSSDSTGQGIAVINAGARSRLDYVRFHGLSHPKQDGWGLTGAVSFYESPVDLAHCQFVANHSEDALNIIRSNFSLDKLLFSHTQSDAFDGDFVTGKITNSVFEACGNDAIDVSGSVIEVDHLLVRGAGDKGLSAGENSQMIATNIDIADAEIAVASKDLSELKAENVTIANSQIGFTVYQKKPEFGASHIKVKKLKMQAISLPYLVEENSSLTVDGESIAANRKNVKDILYGVEYGKSSR